MAGVIHRKFTFYSPTDAFTTQVSAPGACSEHCPPAAPASVRSPWSDTVSSRHLSSSTRRQSAEGHANYPPGKCDKHGPMRQSSAVSSDYQQTSTLVGQGVSNCGCAVRGGWRVHAGRSLNCSCCVQECFEIRGFQRTSLFKCVVRISYLSQNLLK